MVAADTPPHHPTLRTRTFPAHQINPIVGRAELLSALFYLLSIRIALPARRPTLSNLSAAGGHAPGFMSVCYAIAFAAVRR